MISAQSDSVEMVPPPVETVIDNGVFHQTPKVRR